MSDNIPTCSFCSATVKPNVVFFGEDLPEKYFLHEADFSNTDLLIIMGTSLQVRWFSCLNDADSVSTGPFILSFHTSFFGQIEPFASLVNTVKSTVPRLLLNRHAVGQFVLKPTRRGDHVELGDLIDSVQRLAQILGWHSEIQELMQSLEKMVFIQM